jgi:hypothetical protein
MCRWMLLSFLIVKDSHMLQEHGDHDGSAQV